MFILRTGLQGNGKTLNTIKEVDSKAYAEGRVVYYCNVTGFKPDHPAIKAKWLPFDFPDRWFDLPANSMIVIDEAQTWFRVRPQGAKVPEYASRLEIMRKDGHELHCITQSPLLIDAHMRELCNMHVHYHRGNGGQVIKRWVFQKPELTVNKNKLEFQNGESTRITIDKTYFGCYESVKDGTEHHFKFRIPRAAFALVGALALIGALGGYVYTRLSSFTEASEATVAEPAKSAATPAAAAAPAASASSSSQQQPHKTTAEYIAERTPRIAGVPSSAPIYDELTRPVSFPKPSCYATKSPDWIERKRSSLKVGIRRHERYGCSCLSQQGSRMDIPFEACMDM
ncbi:zonular occludens toxin domain-containing protein [Pseudomonas sp. TCU-HL1]|nr:zonular occludens toxin domain-containing protein [Pseudomonas sp. TCU-HL1]AOE88300.1 hypothetical protein THL1_6003 [Pseudomonas sp. TCU-HL1]